MSGRKRQISRAIGISFGLVVIAAFSTLCVSVVNAQVEGGAATAVDPGAMKWAFLAAALATGMGCLGAGVAVAYVGAAAVGAVGEKPEIAGRALIFVGLAEGIAIYGLIVAIMILGKV